MAGKITLEDLARITKNGFEQVDKRFGQVDKRFGQVDKRFGQVDKRFERLEKRVESGFANVNARLDILEKDVKEIREKLQLGISREEYLELDQRLTMVEKKLGIKY